MDWGGGEGKKVAWDFLPVSGVKALFFLSKDTN